MISTRTMQMTLLSTRTMPNDVAKHKNNANESVAQEQWQKTVISTRTMQMRLLSTRTRSNEVSKHKNNANEVAKHKNNGK